eukprot:19050_1
MLGPSDQRRKFFGLSTPQKAPFGDLMLYLDVVDALYAANKYNLQNLIVDCDSFMDGIYESTEYIANIPHILLFETRAIQLNLKVNHKVRQRFQNWLTIE